MAIRRLPPRRVDFARYERWVHASHVLDKTLPALVAVVQGIGWVDAELCAEDADYFARRSTAQRKSRGEFERFAFNESDALTERINLSALWLFGAYELVRTLDKAFGNRATAVPSRLRARVKKLKWRIGRPRMLLAKLEPASHKTAIADRVPANPCFRRDSLAWRVAPRTIISRRELADSILKILERPRRRKATAHG